jgi:hypothetical protein
MTMKLATIGFLALPLLPMPPLAAQDIKIPAGLERLAEKAKDVVDINLDGALLRLAGRFLSDRDSDEAKVKKMVGNLQGIYVKSYTFDHRGAYDPADVEALRAQYRGPGWVRIVGVRSNKEGDNADIFLKLGGDKVTGVAVLVAEPKELTIVSIVGTIDPEDVRALGGHFGIPSLDRVGKGPFRRDDRKDDER